MSFFRVFYETLTIPAGVLLLVIYGVSLEISQHVLLRLIKSSF